MSPEAVLVLKGVIMTTTYAQVVPYAQAVHKGQAEMAKLCLKADLSVSDRIFLLQGGRESAIHDSARQHMTTHDNT